MENYVTRLMEKELMMQLHSSGCVLVSGPKFCGKTTMCEKYSASKIALKRTNIIEAVSAEPEFALQGERPHLIDEWQKVTELWNVIKDDLDQNYEFGKYILTGSTTPVDPEKIQHSGAGRISRMVLKPFTLFESGESTGTVSLKELFNNTNIPFTENSKYKLEDIAFFMCRGGWPISTKADKEYAIKATENYYNGLFKIENESDDFVAFLKNKDIELLTQVLKCYARNVSTEAKNSSMIQDIIANGRNTLTEETFNSYSKTLKDLFIIYDIPAWNLNLRSTVAVRNTPTHYFVDTSIALAALKINPGDLFNDFHSFGMFFEDFVLRDLSVYSIVNNYTLRHYRDSSGQEVDAIVEKSNGEYGAVEIKIHSEKNINEGIKSLINFKNKMIRSQNKLPSFMMILTSHGPCYKTKDGIFIVPITCLKD